MAQAIDFRRGVLLVLLDLSAAFDTLDHSILLLRLRDIGLSQTVFTWFKSYHAGRSNVIKIRKATSAPICIHHGVPQGSVLGPILFNMYILPIADIFKRHQTRYHIYADDTQLYAECSPLKHADALRKIDLTADLTCRLKYRTLFVLLILIYFASLRHEQALPSQHARLLFTPTLHGASITGTQYCVASPTASCAVLRCYSDRRPELFCELGGATGEA